jgi:hypothetical protein
MPRLSACWGYAAIGVAAGILCYELRIPWLPSIAAIALFIVGMIILRRANSN